MKTQTAEEFRKEAKILFGDDPKFWRFKCVQCGHVQKAQDFIDIGENPTGIVFYSCIGRWIKDVGCDWTLGGLFRMHKKEVISEVDGKAVPTFLFDGEEEVK